MKFHTYNEFEAFDFSETYLSDIQLVSGFMHLYLDNVKILPENSCNRDIRVMRTNGLLLKLVDGSLLSLIEEGYKVYNAEGKLVQNMEDRSIDQKDYPEYMKRFAGQKLYDARHDSEGYRFWIDTEDHTYELLVAAKEDVEEWERFLNIV